MMRLSLRLALIVCVALALVMSALFLAFSLVSRPSRAFGVALPVPKQVAAIAELFEKTPPPEWPLIMKALSTPYTKVEVLDARPESRGGLPMPGVAAALRVYQNALDGRAVAIMAELEHENQSGEVEIIRDQFRASRPVRILVALSNGKVMMVEAQRRLMERFTGVRLGMLALIITLVIGAFALWALRAQLRPLDRLVGAVEKFGNRLEVSRLEEEGTVELRHLITAFNRLQANIGDLVKGRTRLITAVGHDLGTYLTRLRLRVEFIADDVQRDKAIRDIEDMHAMMRETLALARLDHEGSSTEPVEVAAALKRQVEIFGETGAAVRYEGCEGPILVQAAGLERAAGNLIANALKYGQEARVSVSLCGEGVEVVVEDRGPGIPPSEREAVLEPFYRLDSARNLNERGFGLGLAIVAEVVKSAGGTLSFEDREGGGLRVRMRLPIAQA